MPLHFAAARSTVHSPIARALAKKAVQRAANDNGDEMAGPSPFDASTCAALRHFAKHGMSAARLAAMEAQNGYDSGDEVQYAWWLGICRTLDRQMAKRLERNLERDSALIY